MNDERLSRRCALKSLAGAGLSGFASIGCASPLQDDPSRPTSRLRNSAEIVDIHPHIISADDERYPPSPLDGRQSDWSRLRPQTFERLIAEMDAAGVAKAAIVQASTYYGFNNTYLADSIARQPRRFTGVASIDVLAPDAVSVLRGWVRRGITGVRIFTGGATLPSASTALDDPRSFPIWEFAVETGLPICVQTGPEGLSSVRNLLTRFPGSALILDHIARPNLEDGPPYNNARSLFDLARYSNLNLKITPRTFELARSGRSTPNAFFRALTSSFGAERIAFGSNLPANAGPMARLVEDALSSLESLSTGDRGMILSGTAKRLYPALA